MPKKPRPQRDRPLSLEEKLGRIWAFIFLGIVLVLLVTLVGKPFLFPR